MAGNQTVSLLVLVALAGFAGICSAATFTVGDNTGWTIPTSASFYSNWASKNTFQIGDVLVFKFPAGAHTVAEVPKTAFDSCNSNNILSPVKTASPANFTLSSAGTHYFICTVTGHCSANQKLAVTVTGPSSAAPAPQPSKKSPSPAPQPSKKSPSPAPSATKTSPSSAPSPPGGSSSPTAGSSPPAGSAPPSEGPGTGSTSPPPSGNFAAPAAAGVSALSLVSLAAVALLF